MREVAIMATLCSTPGNPDMYGLGIRIGFYLQWYSAILASSVAPSEINSLRFSNSLFIAATFVALIVQTARDTLDPIDIYIVSLLMFGFNFYLVPLFLYRAVIGCSPAWDPSRWPRVKQGRTFSLLNWVLVIGASAFQLWFWAKGVLAANRSGVNCVAYGFGFVRVPLTVKGFRIGNIILYVLLLGISIFILLATARQAEDPDSDYRARYAPTPCRAASKSDNLRSARRIKVLQTLESFFRLIVAVIITTATEVTIRWNHVSDVESLDSAGQTIPLLLGIGAFIRVLYFWWKRATGRSADDEREEGGWDDRPPVARVAMPDRMWKGPARYTDYGVSGSTGLVPALRTAFVAQHAAPDEDGAQGRRHAHPTAFHNAAAPREHKAQGIEPQYELV